MQGVILGTAAYMSPEQARGKAVDKRTDIWAFGCVLYELLTGKPAFHGEDVTDILAAVVRAEPDWTALPAKISPSIRVLLRRCLRKDQASAYSRCGDVRIEIEDAIAAPKDSGATQAAPASTSKLLLAVAAVAGNRCGRRVCGAGGGRRGLLSDRHWCGWTLTSDPTCRSAPPLEPTQSFRPTARGWCTCRKGGSLPGGSISPTPLSLQERRGHMLLSSPRTGSGSLSSLRESCKRFRWRAARQSPCAIAANGRGGSWGEDGNIIAALSNSGGLSRIPSAGGPPTPVTDLQSGEITHRWPQILPGGKAVLFTASTTAAAFDAANIEVMSLADHRRKTLVRGGTFGRYLPSGHLIYVNRGTLFAVPFDVDRLEVHGTPAPVLDQVGYNAADGSAQLDFSQTGTLIYRSGGAGGGLLTVAWLDGAGKTQPLLAKPGAYGRPSLSPDGQRLALEVSEGSGTDIWVYDWQRDTMTRLTFTGNAQAPVWSPDGRYIAFRAVGEGMSVIRSDGAGKPQPLTQSKNLQVSVVLHARRKAAGVHGTKFRDSFDLWTVPLESDSAGLRAGKPEVFLQTPADERYPSFSPDGRWMAYASDESGTLPNLRSSLSGQGREMANLEQRRHVPDVVAQRARACFSRLWITTSWWRHTR